MSIPPATAAAANPDASGPSSTLGLVLPTPSSLDGVPPHVEARLRAYGCGLIVRACAAMQQRSEKTKGGGGGAPPAPPPLPAAAAVPAVPAVPAAAAATAQSLLHRYYCRHSLARPPAGDVRRVAAAMTWLALKLEEGYGDAPRVTRRLLLVFARLEARDAAAAAAAATAEHSGGGEGGPASLSSPPPLLLAYSRPYEQRRASLVRIERLALDASGFSCAVEHPHKLLLGLSHVLSAASSSSSSASASASTSRPPSPSPSLAEEAWALANDSLRTPLCVRFGPEVLAAGCLFLASRRLRVALPEGDGEDDKGGGGGGENDKGGGGESESGGGERSPSSGPWWRLLGVSTADVFEVARVVSALLEAEPPAYEDASAFLREKRAREGLERGEEESRAATTAAPGAAAASGLRPPSSGSGPGSAAASAMAKARAAAARAAAARKRPRR